MAGVHTRYFFNFAGINTGAGLYKLLQRQLLSIMELVERDEFLALLHQHFDTVGAGEGHCILICGEAGIGKTSLVKTFCKSINKTCSIFNGTCDALFTPSPLAPVYDIFMQLRSDDPGQNQSFKDRAILFNSILYELKKQEPLSVVIFEDIHWADEATLDFIKFLSRRITQLNCLFVLTYRDDDIQSRYPLVSLLGQLIPGSYTRIELPLLSREAVESIAAEKGRTGKDIYSISGGNPFYVNEILAAYHVEVPASIRDSILYAYNNCDEKAKAVWDILSVIPSAFEVMYLEELVPGYAEEVAVCIHHRILIVENNKIYFKHELFRKAIESILSPLEKVKLHKHILRLFLEKFEKHNELERIVHHAKNANEYELVARYAPVAARQAAAMGAHTEAAKLYLTAIEYYQEKDKDILVQWYEAYAYECYLTSQIKNAIIYTRRALEIWEEKNSIEKTAGSMRFLSRLWWFEGNRAEAEQYAEKAIAVLENKPASYVKAMACSNMSQLKMLANEPAPCIYWGNMAIAMARSMGSQEVLCHALNNVGTVQMGIPGSRDEGFLLLQQSLEIALQNNYQEHVARAYTNLASNAVKTRDYQLAKANLDAGIAYCEDRDLNSWTTYMLSWKARMSLETGNWTDAGNLADALLKSESQQPVVKISALIVAGIIRMRRGEDGALPFLLEAKESAADSLELQRIVPAVVALLEYEWLSGAAILEKEDIALIGTLAKEPENHTDISEVIFWAKKAKRDPVPGKKISAIYDAGSHTKARNAASQWAASGCPYERALLLFEGNDEDKKIALSVVQELGASLVYEKMKHEMRAAGIKNIPRGIRKSTRSNTAFLTSRELDVLHLLKDGLQNKEIAARLFISAKTVDHHISSILVKLDVNSRSKAVTNAFKMEILK